MDVCLCRGEERGGLLAKAAFLEDLSLVEALPLRLDAGNWISPAGGEPPPEEMMGQFSAMGYSAIGLGPEEVARDPGVLFPRMAEGLVPIVLTGSSHPGVSDHLLLPWDGEMLLLLVLADPTAAHPAWFLPPPEFALAEALAANDGLFDRVAIVSWLDTFQMRDLLSLHPGVVDVVLEGLYDFEGVDTTLDGVSLVGVDRCSGFQLVSMDLLEGATGTEERWSRLSIDLGEGYRSTPPDPGFWDDPPVSLPPAVGSGVCKACHEAWDMVHSGPEPQTACRTCHGQGWSHLMDALRAGRSGGEKKEEGNE